MKKKFSFVRPKGLLLPAERAAFGADVRQEAGLLGDNQWLVIDLSDLQVAATDINDVCDGLVRACQIHRRCALLNLSEVALENSVLGDRLMEGKAGLVCVRRGHEPCVVGDMCAGGLVGEFKAVIGPFWRGARKQSRQRFLAEFKKELDDRGAIEEGHYEFSSSAHSSRYVNLVGLSESVGTPSLAGQVRELVVRLPRGRGLVVAVSRNPLLLRLLQLCGAEHPVDVVSLAELEAMDVKERRQRLRRQTVLLACSVVRTGRTLARAIRLCRKADVRKPEAVALVVSARTRLPASVQRTKMHELASLDIGDQWSTKCPLCAVGIPYQRVSASGELVDGGSTYRTAIGKSRVFGRGGLLFPSEFWELIERSGAYYEGHLSYSDNPEMCYADFVYLADVFASSGGQITSHVRRHLLGTEGFPTFSSILCPDTIPAKRFANIVATSIEDLQHVQVIAVPRRIIQLTPAARTEERFAAVRRAAKGFKRSIRNSASLIIDDGSNSGNTLRKLYWFANILGGTATGAAVFLNRMSAPRTRDMAEFFRARFFFCYHLPGGVVPMASCPICKQDRPRQPVESLRGRRCRKQG